MLFRVAFAAAFAALLLNLNAVLGIAGSNAIEKSIFMMVIAIGLTTRRLDHRPLMTMAAVICLIFVMGALTPFPDFSWGLVIGGLNQIIVVYAFLALNPTYADRVFIFKLLTYMPMAAVSLGVLYEVIGVYTLYVTEFASGVSRMQGSLLSPAYLSAVAMCGTYCSLQLALSGDRRYYLSMISNLIILLLAGGRATLVTTGIMCAGSILFSRQLSVARKAQMALISILTAGLVLAVFWERVSTRFGSSGLNGREMMWEYLQSVLDQYPMTGVGFSHQFFIVPESISKIVTSAAHNDYLRLSVELGYIGVTIFYLLFCVAVLIAASRYGRPFSMNVVIALGGFLLLSRSDNAFSSAPEFIIVFLAMLTEVGRQHPGSVRRGVETLVGKSEWQPGYDVRSGLGQRSGEPRQFDVRTSR